MRRIAAISFLALLLYNAFGYYLMFAYEHEQVQVVGIKELPDSAFEKFTFNVAIYSSVANTDFEYVNEDVVIENKTYHIVKKRIYNDSLQLYYLQNFQKDELRKNLNDIVESQLFNKTSTNDTPIKQILKSFLKEYISEDICILVDCCPKLLAESKNKPVSPNKVLLSSYLSSFSPPPEFV